MYIGEHLNSNFQRLGPPFNLLCHPLNHNLLSSCFEKLTEKSVKKYLGLHVMCGYTTPLFSFGMQALFCVDSLSYCVKAQLYGFCTI